MNALTHGILAREALVTAGDGREDAAVFAQMEAELKKDLCPEGPMEHIQVDQMLARLWRWRKVVRYETAATRVHSDTVVDDWETAERERRLRPRHVRVDGEEDWVATEDLEDQAETLRRELNALKRPDPLAEVPDLWFSAFLLAEERFGVQIDAVLDLSGRWTDEDDFPRDSVERVITFTCETHGVSRSEFFSRLRAKVERDLDTASQNWERRRLAIERQRLLASLPDERSLAKVQRYESHLSRKFYKAFHELQSLQAARQGGHRSTPPVLDLDVQPM